MEIYVEEIERVKDENGKLRELSSCGNSQKSVKTTNMRLPPSPYPSSVSNVNTPAQKCKNCEILQK